MKLIEVIKEGDIEVVGLLISKGADVSERIKEFGDTPLHQASCDGCKELVDLLISNGADVNAKNKYGSAPLDWATKYKQTEIVAILRKHGGKHGTIISAARYGSIQGVQEFLANGADVNVYHNDYGGTPLHMAVIFCHKEIVKLLLAEGGDVNAKDWKGGTPLHIAVGIPSGELQELLTASSLHRLGFRGIAKMLIAKGANENAKADNGATPLDMASGKTADLLRKHGGKTGEELKAEGK
jgi:cytohesin